MNFEYLAGILDGDGWLGRVSYQRVPCLLILLIVLLQSLPAVSFVHAATCVITLATSPTGLNVRLDAGTWYAAPKTYTVTKGTQHSIEAQNPDVITANQERYVWASWSDSGANPHNVAPSVATTYTATMTHQWYVTITSSGIAGDSSGTVATLDGQAKTQAQLSYSAWFNNAYSLAYSFSSPVSASAGKQYIWSSTSGLSQTLQSNTFSVSTYGTITGTYHSQYTLTAAGQLNLLSLIAKTAGFSKSVQVQLSLYSIIDRTASLQKSVQEQLNLFSAAQKTQDFLFSAMEKVNLFGSLAANKFLSKSASDLLQLFSSEAKSVGKQFAASASLSLFERLALPIIRGIQIITTTTTVEGAPPGPAGGPPGSTVSIPIVPVIPKPTVPTIPKVTVPTIYIPSQGLAIGAVACAFFVGSVIGIRRLNQRIYINQLWRQRRQQKDVKWKRKPKYSRH